MVECRQGNIFNVSATETPYLIPSCKQGGISLTDRVVCRFNMRGMSSPHSWVDESYFQSSPRAQQRHIHFGILALHDGSKVRKIFDGSRKATETVKVAKGWL